MPAPIPLRHWKGEVVKRWLNDVVEKRCIKCKAWKPQDDTHFQFISTRGHYHSVCRVCSRAANRARYVRQPVNT